MENENRPAQRDGQGRLMEQPETAAPAKTKPDVKITDAHRVIATRAALARNVVLLDLGPSDPPPLVEHATPEEIEARKAAVRAHADWHKANKEPVTVEMAQVDANHALGADPDRYVLVPPGIRAPITLEERVANIERRLGPETPEEIEHRARRDEEIARRQEAEREKAVA